MWVPSPALVGWEQLTIDLFKKRKYKLFQKCSLNREIHFVRIRPHNFVRTRKDEYP